MAPQTSLDTSLDTWPTLWRTYADTKDLVYFYESALELKFLWTNFTDHDFVKWWCAKVGDYERYLATACGGYEGAIRSGDCLSAVRCWKMKRAVVGLLPPCICVICLLISVTTQTKSWMSLENSLG